VIPNGLLDACGNNGLKFGNELKADCGLKEADGEEVGFPDAPCIDATAKELSPESPDWRFLLPALIMPCARL
jgi:hypothetical protein